MNISENFELASEYSIYSVPRLLVFNRNRKPLHELRGLASEGEIARVLNQVIGTL